MAQTQFGNQPQQARVTQFSSNNPSNVAGKKQAQFGDFGICSIPLTCCCGIPALLAIIAGFFIFRK
jgi:hypothetical protein